MDRIALIFAMFAPALAQASVQQPPTQFLPEPSAIALFAVGAAAALVARRLAKKKSK